MLTDFLILLGMFAAFVLVCFIADAFGLSLFDHSNKGNHHVPLH